MVESELVRRTEVPLRHVLCPDLPRTRSTRRRRGVGALERKTVRGKAEKTDTRTGEEKKERGKSRPG